MGPLLPGVTFWPPSIAAPRNFSAASTRFTTQWGGLRHPSAGPAPDLEKGYFEQAGWPPIRVRVLRRTEQYKR